MSTVITPEIALAMLKNERLSWVDRRAEAEDKVRVIDAQISGAELMMKLQAEAVDQQEASEAIDETVA